MNNNNEFDALYDALVVAMNTSKASLDEVKNIRDEIYNSAVEVKAVGEFMLDFYKEYRKDDRVTSGQQKVLKREMGNSTTNITKQMFPSLKVDKSRKSEFYDKWYKVNKGLWSIYRHLVNNNECGYSETPKVKFDAALKYILGLTLADYMAYQDYRWKDIKKFTFELTPDDEITLASIVEGYKDKQLKETYAIQ